MAAPKKTSTSEIEEELKIKLSLADLEKVLSSFAKKESKSKISHKYLPRAYYDTPDLELYAQRISLRLQYNIGSKGVLGGYKQTIKFPLSSGRTTTSGTVLRKECADALSGSVPDLFAVTDKDAQKVMAPFKNKKLKHIFTAAIERRFFNVTAGKGKDQGTVELAFDVGSIVLPATGQSFDFAEIEIELKKGSNKAIDKIKERIFELAPSAKIEKYTSKADEGTKLYTKHVLKR